ncbi:MAG: STAS domain-containing protein [Acetobacteraceae bacterium]
MEVSHKIASDVVLARVEGWIDATTAKDFEAALEPLLAHPTNRVVLDFALVTYIASAGLRVVLDAAKKIRVQRGRFVICGASDAVKRVFDVSGFSRIITLVSTEDEAITLMRANGM